MSRQELLRRYLVFLLGLYVNALGISFIIKAGLGSSPISSVPYTVSLGTPLTLGMLTFVLNFLLVIGQILLLGKDFKKEQWLQLPVTVVFSAFIDLSMWSLGFVHPTDYFWQIVALLVGCAILGFGVSLEVVGNVVMLGGEAFVSALSRITKKEFGLMKVCFDTSLMLLACLISLLMFGSIEGVREGTVIAALLVGFFARVFNRRLNGLRRWVSAEDDMPRPRRTSTDEYPVITIAREYGSGGREIGRRVAKDLGFAFYDKELIDLVAQENHLKPDVVERKEQNLSSTLLYELVMQDFTAPVERSLSFDDALFVAQSRVIRRLAAQGPCVIVGRFRTTGAASTCSSMPAPTPSSTAP